MADKVNQIEAPAKSFATIQSIVSDAVFAKKVDDVIGQLRKERRNRPAAPAGFKYKRTQYDRMVELGQFNASFFIENVEAVWEKRSALSAQTRDIINTVCTRAFEATLSHYVNQNAKK
jgi:hypothetical protein